jgi:hypothetical protein
MGYKFLLLICSSSHFNVHFDISMQVDAALVLLGNIISYVSARIYPVILCSCTFAAIVFFLSN